MLAAGLLAQPGATQLTLVGLRRLNFRISRFDVSHGSPLETLANAQVDGVGSPRFWLEQKHLDFGFRGNSLHVCAGVVAPSVGKLI